MHTLATTTSSASQAVASQPSKPTLCVDLDNSLLATDLLWETFLAAIKRNPIVVLLAPLWLMRGRAYLKARLAERAELRLDLLPYREDVVRYLCEEKRSGRSVWLVTGSDGALANRLASYLGVFDEVVASDGRRNLSGATKADFLVREFGRGCFSYLGDSRRDVTVWRRAASALVVSGSDSLARQAAQVTQLEKRFTVPRTRLKDIARALRLRHWSKNALLFLPMLLAHKFRVISLVREAIAFVCFGLAASSIYVLNDLLDLQSDRQHPWKSARPLAAGCLSIPSAMFLSAVLGMAAIIGSWIFLGATATFLLASYCALSISYCLFFKRIALGDVFVLTSFYTLRILTGGVIAPVRLSPWFMAFSGLFFFSLALAKRYSELVLAQELVSSGNSGRGYRTGDHALLSELGVGSALAAIVIFCLYTQSPDVLALYARPSFVLMVAPLLLFWTARLWLKAHRGQLDEDPISLALKDPASYWVGLAAVLLIAMGTLR
jgi:4-hydroxybenzoate polyprenyltransferase